MEAALQPSAGMGKTAKSSALELLNAQLDIVGDEKQDLIQKQRLMRWDKQKRKYIATTVGDEAAGLTHAKKVRLESGAVLEGKKAKEAKLGALYEKWQAKTNKSVGRQGVFDEIVNDDDAAAAAERDAEPGRTPGGKKINPRWQTKEKLAQKAGNKKRNEEEIKSASAIKKKREQDAKNKVKNMKKSDRASYERHQKAKSRGGDKPGGDKPGGAGGGGKKAAFSKGKPKGKR